MSQKKCRRSNAVKCSTRKRGVPDCGMDSIMASPAIPEGEDQTSFKRHCKILIAEFKKSHPNYGVVSPLMQRSFAFRRADILSNPVDVQTLFSKYPILQHGDQVSGIIVFLTLVTLFLITANYENAAYLKW